MGLVDYSDSDNSDVEIVPAAKPVPSTSTSTSTSTSKPTFQKVVDRSNPGKIKVSLPQATIKDNTKDEGPPSKRVKSTGGTFGGFNSFLPAPKRTGQGGNGTLLGGNTGKKGGLGAGVNLKTGSAPGFSREPEPERYDEEVYTEKPTEDGRSALGFPAPEAAESFITDEGAKPVAKPMMFRPLSVSRKPVKKKKVVAGVSAEASTTPPITPLAAQKLVRPKGPLFSMGVSESTHVESSNGEYKPMMVEELNVEDEVEDEGSFNFEPSYEDYEPNNSQLAPPPAVPTPPVSQSLDDIAGDLKLSAAERRQLFGRQKGGMAKNVINFNTDQEYLHNEGLRNAGEQAVHNPVRSIAPGKHSLKQLVNAAQSQKDALEESFNKGKSNRAEASSRYGW